MMERLGWYAFCLMFVGIGLVALVWFGVFMPGDDRWLMGPAFIAGGILGMVGIRALKKSDDRRATTLAEAARGKGTVTAVKTSMRTSGNHTSGFWLTMTVEFPGRAPFQSRTHMSVSHDVMKKLQPGLVLPVRVHPSKPDKVMIGTDQWLNEVR